MNTEDRILKMVRDYIKDMAYRGAKKDKINTTIDSIFDHLTVNDKRPPGGRKAILKALLKLQKKGLAKLISRPKRLGRSHPQLWRITPNTTT